MGDALVMALVIALAVGVADDDVGEVGVKWNSRFKLALYNPKYRAWAW